LWTFPTNLCFVRVRTFYGEFRVVASAWDLKQFFKIVKLTVNVTTDLGRR